MPEKKVDWGLWIVAGLIGLGLLTRREEVAITEPTPKITETDVEPPQVAVPTAIFPVVTIPTVTKPPEVPPTVPTAIVSPYTVPVQVIESPTPEPEERVWLSPPHFESYDKPVEAGLVKVVNAEYNRAAKTVSFTVTFRSFRMPWFPVGVAFSMFRIGVRHGSLYATSGYDLTGITYRVGTYSVKAALSDVYLRIGAFAGLVWKVGRPELSGCPFILCRMSVENFKVV